MASETYTYEAPPASATGPNRRLRVGVDFHSFDGIYQGSRARLVALFQHLVGDLSDDLDLVLYSGAPDALRGALPVADPARVTFAKLNSHGPIGRLLLEFPRLARRDKLDAFHAQYILPEGLACGQIVSQHDILFESHPEYFSRFFTLRSKLLMRRSAARADAVITISDYSAHELQVRYGVEPERIALIPCAVDHERFHPEALDPAALARRGLEVGGYLLVVGRLDPRKNSAALVEAYAAQDVTDLPLVFVGQLADPATAKALEAVKLHGKKRVVIMSDVDDDELPGLYAGAKVFLFPSHAEGFGMPILEAMSSGTPVLTSNTTSMPEVARDAALYVDPTSAADVQRGLETIMQADAAGDELRDKLRTAGLLRADQYSWKHEAKSLGALYRKVAAASVQR